MAKNTIKCELNLQGLDLSKWLKDFNPATQTRILEGALATASRPIVRDAKSRINDRTGALRRSIGFILRRYPKTGRLVAIIGPRNGVWVQEKSETGKKKLRRGTFADEKRIVPAFYAHLVEFGHRSVHGGGALPNMGEKVKGVWNSVNADKSIRAGTVSATSFVAPRPFLRPAFDAGKENALDALKFGFIKALQAESRRVESKFNRMLKSAA